MTFVHRAIDLVLTYAQGAVDSGLPPKVETLSGHRVVASVSVSGGAGMSAAQIRVYGMTLSRMNELSTIGLLPMAFKNNTVTVNAGDAGSPLSQVFQGTIQAAWIDTTGAPDVCFNISALGGMWQSLQVIPASSFPGDVDVADVLKGLAGQMGLQFKNNGVSVILAHPNFPGSARDQAMAAIHDAGCEGIIDGGVLEIWPRGGVRDGAVPIISPSTGMVGYPTYSPTGLFVTSRFNPAARFGAAVEVQSSLPQANQQWKVVNVMHDIEAEVPGGRWFTQMQLCRPGYVAVPQ